MIRFILDIIMFINIIKEFIISYNRTNELKNYSYNKI